MNWSDYLALLLWQDCEIFFQDFARLKAHPEISTPENLVSVVSSLKTKEYLIHNKHWWKKAEADYKYCEQKNYQILHPDSLAYPQHFSHFFNKVPVFLVLGHLPKKNITPITFVGSRKANPLTLDWMDFYLPPLLKQKSFCVVSGGARGIDQKAHAIAIRSQKPTLCFLPSGLDHFYPNSLYPFKTGVLDNGGAFISCFPPWAEMRKAYFHIRNSFMAAYSSLVLILQASMRSGTMITASKAMDYGVPLGVLPGPVLSSPWTGNLQLIYDGAFLIRDGKDLSLLIESLNVKQDTI